MLLKSIATVHKEELVLKILQIQNTVYYRKYKPFY